MNIYEINTSMGVRKFTEYRGGIGTTVYRCHPSSADREDNSVPRRLRWRKRLKVVGIRDHTWHGGSGREPNAIADLDDGTWCFVWNLYEEIPATTSVPDAPPQMTVDNLREMFKGVAPPSKQAVPGLMGMPRDEHDETVAQLRDLFEILVQLIENSRSSNCILGFRVGDAKRLTNVISSAIGILEGLEKGALVLHEYPAEKPPESGIVYLVLIDGEIPRLAVYGHHVLYEDDTMNKWYSDEGPAKGPTPYGETEITHWAYLPAPPMEENERKR